jgi:hypothetical protein
MGDFRKKTGVARIHHFETIPDAGWKPDIHHPRRMIGARRAKNP